MERRGIGRRSVVQAALAAGMTPGLARAQAATAWPERAVRIVNRFAAGASHDVPVGILGETLAQRLGQPFVSENRTGAGTTPHLAGELFKARLGIAAQHVPYREGAQRVLDVVSGALDFAVDNVATCMGRLREGKLRALAVASAERRPTLPEIPTMADFMVPSWGAFCFPTGTPAPLVGKLAAEVRARSLPTPPRSAASSPPAAGR